MYQNKPNTILESDVNIESGIATGGNQTTLIDTTKSLATDIWKGAFIEIVIGEISYIRTVVSNNATTITFATLPGAITVISGVVYNIKLPVSTSTIADGGDITLGAKADAPATTGTTDSWSVISMLKGVYNKLGAVVLSTSSSIIGKVGIDQTTNGTTNKVTADLYVGGTVVSNSVPVPVNIVSNLIKSGLTMEIQTPFAKNTAAGTEQAAIQILKPTNPVLLYKAAMTNSSIDSTLTVKLFNRRTFTITGVAQTDGAPDNTHIVLVATANPTNDHYNGFVITITAGTGIGQIRTISDYVGANTVRAEVSVAWTVTPDNTSVYSIALVRDSLAWTGSFAKASLTAPIIKSNDSEIITGLFDNDSDVYYVVSNDTLIANADASRFTAVFQLIPVE